MGFGSADAIFGHLPIHPDLRRGDREMFRNSVQFALCRVFDEVTRRLDVPALGDSIAAASRRKAEDDPTEEHGCGSTSWPDAIPAALGGLEVPHVAFVPDAGQRPADRALPGRIRGSAPSC